MKIGFVSLISVCALSWLIQDHFLTVKGADSQSKSEFAITASLANETPRQTAGGSEYYIDCAASEANGDGHSPTSAWHSLDAINAHTFSAGDTIYLKRGTECRGSLWPKGSGTSSATIRLSAYGKGVRPKVMARKGDEEAFKLFDQEYWDVDSIDISGGTQFGVFVSGQTGVLHHIHMRNLLVHGVHGEEVKHKESGLIVISPGKVEQHFDDVLVEGVTAFDTDQWAGILIGGGNFGEVEEKDWSTHVIVRNSVVHDVYGDGIVLFRVKNGLIDSSAAWRTGMQPTQTIGTPNAIWTWMCTDCVVSRNEAFLTDSPGVDGGAFDIDWGNTRNSVLDNYAHDTQGYCIAVFGAGYVTRESVVEGNLCISNGRGPRMARYQGAIFVYTWNNGVVENLRVEKNTIYWEPPGDYPAVLNRADIRGSQRVFRENQIYSASASLVETNKNLTFQANRYSTCGANRATWTFENHAYDALDEYRAAANQEQGSSWKPDTYSTSCLAMVASRRKERSNPVVFGKNHATVRGTAAASWTVVSELSASIGPDGLLDAASVGQLLVLKNLGMEFHANGLRMRITLDYRQTNANESLQNAIRDLGMADIKTSESLGHDIPARPKTRLIAPDGSVEREWKDFVGPAEIGLAVRAVLREPLYSQMESEGK